MTWIHAGKTSAFEQIELNSQTLKEYDIEFNLADITNLNVFVTKQALAMLQHLNMFDQRQVMKEICHVNRYPNSCSSTKHSIKPFRRLFRTKNQFRSYHYLIEFKIDNNDQVIIHDIYFDQDISGRVQLKDRAQRNMLHGISRIGNGRYPGPVDDRNVKDIQEDWVVGTERYQGVVDSNDVKRAQEAWVRVGSKSQVDTEHAAVNGMLNNLEKASWLMGAHLDVAYPKDDFKTYTLFHNPTDRLFYDLVECVFDKFGGTNTQNAEHLAAILYQTQQQGKKIKWVVHSQGAIIFNSALLEFKKRKSSRLLTSQQLVIHSPGAHTNRLVMLAKEMGMTVHQPRSNPYDIVANHPGRAVELSPSSLVRSLSFLGLVAFGTELNSPHTLPYLGIQSYLTQLDNAGNRFRAKAIRFFLKNKI